MALRCSRVRPPLRNPSTMKPGPPAAQSATARHVACPAAQPDFTGRDRLLVQVRETLLRAFPGVVVLQGPGGVGKTQLSIEYAHRFASDYDTVWAIDSEQPELITGQFADLAVAIGAATPAGRCPDWGNSSDRRTTGRQAMAARLR